jgi:hypothetical protein
MRKVLWLTLILLFASFFIPAASAQDSQGLEWGVEENDRFYYDVITKQVYLGETTTATERLYIEIQDLPDLSTVNGSILTADLGRCYENETQIPMDSSFAYLIRVYTIGMFHTSEKIWQLLVLVVPMRFHSHGLRIRVYEASNTTTRVL